LFDPEDWTLSPERSRVEEATDHGRLRGMIAVAANAICRTWTTRDDDVATYVLLSTLTPEGGHTLHTHPERMAHVNQEITDFVEKLGGEEQIGRS
jgi:hypothetical protein